MPANDFEKVERARDRHERQQPGVGRRRPVLSHQLAYGGVQARRDPHQRRRRNAVGAALVFLNLLEGHAERAGQGLLVDAPQSAAKANPRSDRHIDRIESSQDPLTLAL